MSGESTESSSWLVITPKALFLLNQDDCCNVKLAIPLKEVQAKMSLSSIIGENGVVGTGNESSSAADQMAAGISFTLRQQGVVGHSRVGGIGGVGSDLAEPFNVNLNMREFFDSFDAASMSTQIEEINRQPGENLLHVKMPLLEGEMFMLYFEILSSSLE